MKGKTFARVLAVCLAVIVGGTAILAVDSPETLRKIEQKRRFARRGVTQRWDEYRKDYRDYRNIPLLEARGPATSVMPSPAVVDDGQTGASLLSVLDADTLPSPGIAIGITSYDAQADFAIGREVASNPGSETVHFLWTMWDIIPTAADEKNRYVNYNSWDKVSGSTNQGFNGATVTLGEFSRGGFCRIDVDGDNLCNGAFHQRIEDEFPYSTWYINFPIEGSALHIDKELQKPTLFPDEVEMRWPDVAVEQNGGEDNASDILHVIAMGVKDARGEYAEPSNHLWYYRYNSGDPLPIWQGPVLIDSTRILGYTIDADDNSNNVCLVYHSDYSTDGMNGLNNIAYRESQTSGTGWITGAELGPLTKNFATSDYNAYYNAAGPQAWTETSVAYDNAGDLHILFTEQRVANESEHIALKHWSKSRGTVRTVQIAYYDNYGTWARTLNLGHISLGVGDGATLCRGGIETNENYLYAIYTKLGGETPEEAQDMSQLGYSNGELWLTASNSNGDTWAPPTNLSNTKFPECTSRHPDSVCASEAWPSLARDVHDIEILYIQDFEAGAFDEASWTMNRVMYLNLPGGPTDAAYMCPPIAPSFAAYLTHDPECEYHAAPGYTNTETLTIWNFGNDDMDGEVMQYPNTQWLSVETYPPVYMSSVPYWIGAGGSEVVMPVYMVAAHPTFGTPLPEGLYIGEIAITHNDTSRASPYVIPIEFFVAWDFACPLEHVLKTAVASPGVLSLEVVSNGRFGAKNPEGGLWRFMDSSSTVFDASLLVAFGGQPTMTGDTIVFHRFYNSDDPGQGGLRPATDSWVDTSAYGTGDGYALGVANITTHAEGLFPDEALGIVVRWYFPQNPAHGDFVISKYTIWNRTESPIYDVVVGLWADLDVIEASHMDDLQRGVDNHGNYVQAQNLIYQYGYDTVGHIPWEHLNSVQRYSAGVSYLSGRDATGMPFMLQQVPIRGGVGDNRDNTDPLRPNSRFFYRTMVGGPGVSIWEPAAHWDSAKDCYTWLLLDQGLTLEANGGNAEEYVVAWVSDTLQHDAYERIDTLLTGDLHDVIDSAWAWAARNIYCRCDCHTDPQCDGVTNVLDVVHAVNVAFRSYLPVFDDDCPYERTDVDCTGFTNVLDVVRMVNVAFRGGSPQVNFCDGCND
ncbi:MAG TPA: hypothetical protein VM118_04840 [Acidobacteriota bacterium]|nr:hypothetical protein [Acidobacteriota bacterium]